MHRAGAAALTAVAAGPAAVDQQAGGRSGRSASVSLEQARRVLAADERRAQRIGVPMHIVVLDASDGTCLVPFDRDISHRARVATNGGAHPGAGETAGFIKTELPDSTSARVETNATGGRCTTTASASR